MKKMALIIGFFASTLVLLSIFFTQEDVLDTSEKDDRITLDQTLRVGFSRLRISLPVFVAMEKGLFEKNGLDVQLEMYDTAQPLMQALIEGRVNAAGYTALPITFNGMLRSGKELYFLTSMIEDSKHRISYFIKPAGSTLSSIRDLKGKTIGILPTIAYKGWLEAILRANQIDPEQDVRIQQIAPSQQPRSLQTGAIDILFTNDPAATTAIELGVGEILDPTVVEVPLYINDPFLFGSFNVSKEWADSNPEVFSRIKAALDEAVSYIDEFPEESKLAMVPYLSDTFAKHAVKYPNSRYSLSQNTREEDFEKTIEFYLEAGIIPKELSVKGLIVNE